MKSAKEVEVFPYTSKLLCYFEVGTNGQVSQVPHINKSDREKLQAAYKRAVNREVTLYAVWPGNWRSDLFIIDDLDIFASKFELLDV